MENDILANISREGKSLDEFLGNNSSANSDGQEDATPADSPAEKGSEEETPPSPDGGTQDAAASASSDNSQDESKLPFHKHPRWKAMHEENESLKASLKEFMDAQRQVLERVAPPQVKQQETQQIPDWFAKAYGEDVEVWNVYQNFLKEQREAIKSDLIREQKEAQEREIQERTQHEQWVDNSLASVEKTFGVKLEQGNSVTNEFIKFVIDYKPTDEMGNLDLVNGWKLFQTTRRPQEQVKQAASAARKSIASSTMSTDKGQAGSKSKDFFTSADFRGKRL